MRCETIQNKNRIKTSVLFLFHIVSHPITHKYEPTRPVVTCNICTFHIWAAICMLTGEPLQQHNATDMVTRDYFLCPRCVSTITVSLTWEPVVTICSTLCFNCLVLQGCDTTGKKRHKIFSEYICSYSSLGQCFINFQ